MKFLKKIFDFFSSVKLAVILILSMAVFFGYGTFYEAEHGTQLAQKLVYHGWFATILLFLFVANLACAAIDRLPWKKNHIGFVLTHLGIITMLLGAFVTQQRGLDGALYLGIDQSSSYFTVDQTVLRIYQSFDGKPQNLIHQQEIDLDKTPPQKNDISIPLVDGDVLKIIDYHHKAIRNAQVTPAREGLPAFKFQLSNTNVSVEEWLGLTPELPPFYDLGPALITFIRGKSPLPPKLQNQIVVTEENEKLKYAIYSSKQKAPTSQGTVEIGKEIATGWMNLKFKITQYIPKANVIVDYEPVHHNDPLGGPVFQAQIGSKKSWFELDSPHELRGDKLKYFISFVRKRYDLGFKIKLEKFKMGLYGGTTSPSSYESTVSLDQDPTLHIISMNEPLKHKGFTLYQSSFEQNERGEAIASIFSVNYDPGRFLKYLGCSCMILGIMTMFYWKPKWTRKKAL